MSLSSPFILRPIGTSLVMIAILLAGLVAFKVLPVAALPEVDYPTIQVQAFFPGASPEVMASSVTAPLERQFGEMAGLNQMNSISSSGAMTIILQFSLTTSLDVAEQEVQAAINAASTYLPANLPNPPIYNKVNPADTPILTLALTSKTMPLTQVEDFADTRLVQRIAQLPGVGLVTINGGQRPAVRIQANPNALSAYGLTLEDLRSAIITANVNAPKGSFDGPERSYIINANDQLLTSNDYKPLIIAYNQGAPVRLSDVALAIDAPENVYQAAWMNTTPAIILNIQRQPGANVIAVVDRIKQLLPTVAATLPSAIQLSIVTDRTNTIRASVTDAQSALILAVCLVVMVIFLFLRNLSATIIPSFSVPISLIGTFSAMYLLGFSLNNLTLMALTIATGFVVDDAIVMIENISRFLEQGDSPLQAALKGSGQIGFTILSLTVSLIAVLIPLLFMGDVIGRLFREFAITLTVAVLLSGFISLTLTPMLCSRILRPQNARRRPPSRFEQTAQAIQENVMTRYSRSLQWVLENRSLTLLVAVVTLAITLIMIYVIPKGFFPLEDTGVIQGISEAPQSISFAAMAERQQALARVILQDPAVANLSSFIGIDGVNTTLNSGRILITLKPRAQRDNVEEVINRLQPKLAQVSGITLYMQPTQDVTIDSQVTRTQYQYSLSSPNSAEVNHWTALMVERLQKSPSFADVTSDQQNLGLQIFIDVDRDTVSRLGFTMQLVDDILYDAFGQRQVSIMFTQTNQYHVVLEALPELQKGPFALDHIYLNATTNLQTALANSTTTNANAATPPTPSTSNSSSTNAPSLISPSSTTAVTNTPATSASVVPLSVFTKITQGISPLLIRRLGQFPAAMISFNLAPGATLGGAVAEINNIKQELAMPDSMETSFQGAAQAFQNALNYEGWLVLAAIIVVYIVLGILYESYIHPLTILSTLPSACLGALFILWLSGNPLSVIAIIGIILLIGIVLKNAILMIDFALELERLQNKLPREAIFEAAMLRFRPILMTTLVAILGAVPLALGSGMGAELRRPLGIVIIAGLAVSQMLTLYTTPVIYLTFDALGRRLNSIRGQVFT